jgi:hypothetical protein
MEFDLSAMKWRSIRLITDLILAVTLGSLAFSAVIFFLIRRTLLVPIRSVTQRIGQIAQASGTDVIVGMPEFASAEMVALAREVERACEVRRSD